MTSPLRTATVYPPRKYRPSFSYKTYVYCIYKIVYKCMHKSCRATSSSCLQRCILSRRTKNWRAEQRSLPEHLGNQKTETEANAVMRNTELRLAHRYTVRSGTRREARDENGEAAQVQLKCHFQFPRLPVSPPSSLFQSFCCL